MTLTEIERFLLGAYFRAPKPILKEAEALSRAKLVFDDMNTIGFTLDPKIWPMRMPDGSAIGVPSYILHGSQFNLNASESVNDVYKAEGPGLNCGDFLRLSKACSLARTYLSNDWPRAFTTRLKDPNDHPAVVEEVLWLGYWRDLKSVVHGYRQNPATRKDVDWRFTTCGQPINLENKYRRRDWIGRVDGPHFSRDFDSYFDDCEGKFGPQVDGELNIIGITTLAPADAGFRSAIDRYLRHNKNVDAIILWSYHAPNGETPEIHSRKADLVRLLFTGGDAEDHSRMSPFTHLLRKSEERRALRPGEFPKEMF
jgi:hypothetical protein